MNAPNVIILAIICALATLSYGGLLSLELLKLPVGHEQMQKIALTIQEGANAYLERQSKTLALVGAGVFILIWLSLDQAKFPYIALCFAMGAIFAAVAGVIGMNMSVRANVRTAQAATQGLSEALEVAFKGGAVTGLTVVGLGILGLSGFYLLYVQGLHASLEAYPKYIVGFGFGGSLISLFARGGDGMGADLFDTYAVTLIAAMLLGSFAFTDADQPARAVLFPLAMGAAAMVTSLVATWFVKLKPGSHKIMGAMYKGTTAAIVLSALVFFVLSKTFFPEDYWGYFLAALIGLSILVLIILITEYYTSTRFKPVKFVAEQSRSGSAPNIIAGLAVGLESTLAPVLVLCAGTLTAYWVSGGWSAEPSAPLQGLYGVAIAATGLLSSCSIMVAIEAFGSITDNADDIAEMAQLPAEYRDITNTLEAVSNTAKAVAKSYAIASATLAALVLFVSYTQEIAQLRQTQGLPPPLYLLSDLRVLIGLFLGGMLPFFFSSRLMTSEDRIAPQELDEVPSPFKPLPGSGVDSLTRAALKERMLPGVLAMVMPLLVGLLLGPLSLGGLLVGANVTGLLMAIFTTTTGAAWDNALKYVEMGYFGGQNFESHQAAVVGETVGHPFKDTAGPALNPMIKILNIVALLGVHLIASGGLLRF